MARADVATPGAPLRVAGVELGGTKCICTLGDTSGAILERATIPTRTPGVTLGAIRGQLATWSEGASIAALGIGSFGPIDLDPVSLSFGHILATAKPGWSGTPVLQQIGGELDAPTAFDTDVNAAALAELRWGAGREFDRIAYVTIGTGIGVGFASSIEVSSPVTHAELGHVRVVRRADDARRSVCPFHDDCAEGLASGSAVTDGLAAAEVDALTADDARWTAPIDYLGQLCHTIVCAAMPQRIVLGGGAVVRHPALIARIEHAMRHSLNGYIALPEAPLLVAAGLGGDAGPRGTLALAIDQLARAQAGIVDRIARRA